MGLIEAMTEKDSYTQNGALTNSTSHNFNLDLFFLAGACRNESVENIEKILVKSYAYNRVKTLKIIFYTGDIREGAGERRFFSIALNWLYQNHREDLYSYLENIPEFSRWDVLFQFKDDKVLDYIVKNFKAGNSLLCKWLPRKITRFDKHKVFLKPEIKGTLNTFEELPKKAKEKEAYFIKSLDCNYAYIKDEWVKLSEDRSEGIEYFYTVKSYRNVKGKYAEVLLAKLGWSPRVYRKHLVKYTNVVEQKMCSKSWGDIEYSHVPSVAMHKYNKAWYRNDKDRFEQYLESVKKGESKINAGAIFPHDIIGQAVEYNSCRPLTQAEIVQWENLPDYMTDYSILPICDTSASMTWYQNALAMKISLALGLYISERNKGIFKDAFITFSQNPKMQYLKGNINERITQLCRQDFCGNTDIEGVFDEILSKAKQNNLPESDMPRSVLIISDMEFDECTTGTYTSHEVIVEKYRQAGYRCPNLIYWNVNGHVGNVPVTKNDYGAALISGASPSILKAVLTDNVSPEKIMDSVIERERYQFIV